jgi:hypothetical protein
MSTTLSRRLFLTLMGLAGVAAAVPPVEEVFAEPLCPEIIPPSTSPGVIMRADRSFEIFIGGDGGAGSWRKVGELESIEISDNSRIIESSFGNQSAVRKGTQETAFKIEAFEPDPEIEDLFRSDRLVPARVTVDGATFRMPAVRFMSSVRSIRASEPSLVTYEGIGMGQTTIEDEPPCPSK